MAFGKVEDLTGSCELVIFPDSFARFEMQLRDERPVLLRSLEVEEGLAKIMVDTVSPLEDILKKPSVWFLRLDKLDTGDYPRQQSLMRDYPGTTSVSLEIEVPEVNRKVLMEMTDAPGVSVNNDFFEGVHLLFGRTTLIELRS